MDYYCARFSIQLISNLANCERQARDEFTTFAVVVSEKIWYAGNAKFDKGRQENPKSILLVILQRCIPNPLGRVTVFIDAASEDGEGTTGRTAGYRTWLSVRCAEKNWQKAHFYSRLQGDDLGFSRPEIPSPSWRLSHINVISCSCNVFWISRILNNPAHYVAKWAFSSKQSGNFALWEVPPL
ncbi:hypothetical protein PanWU01x14_308270 [Parasponia andersonii]|uniref:Uncharacterized protein n=1 Tax=Parasponia andersonii TaxID=3476 RepID=A0A2P5ARB7_PARAD|nr:hypothetical protein PanWU01x14_308270 [Parasponia andersonii]